MIKTMKLKTILGKLIIEDKNQCLEKKRKNNKRNKYFVR